MQKESELKYYRKRIGLLFIFGLVLVAAAGIMKNWYYHNAFVCVTQGRIDWLAACGFFVLLTTIGFMIGKGWFDGKRK